MTPAGFDFRAPPAGELEKHAGGWLTAAAKQAGPVWAKLLPFPADLTAGPAEPAPAAVALNGLPTDAVGFRIDCPGTLPMLLAIPRPPLLALLTGLLGETPPEIPADRELTGLEVSLAGFLSRELFLGPLEKAWPVAEEPLPLTASPPGLPRTVWRVPGEDMMLVARLTAVAPFGEVPATLVTPRAGKYEKLARPIPRPAPPPPADPTHIEALVREMTVDVAVLLGEADLSLFDLATLRAGDLVLLRQKVGEPLAATVGGATKFRVWPGAVGGRAAVRIDAAAE